MLVSVYGIEITGSQVNAEVRRIDASTRAPEMLAELKAALGNNPARFARTVARPLVVERVLRSRYENDDVLHATGRRQAEAAREAALLAREQGLDTQTAAMKKADHGTINEVTWQLGSPPEDSGDAAHPQVSGPAPETEFLTGFDPNDATDWFQLTMTGMDATGADLELNKVIPGRTYTVQAGTDLQNFAETVSSFNVTSKEHPKVVEDPNTSGRLKQYRVEVKRSNP